jgi:hypothetical protein
MVIHNAALTPGTQADLVFYNITIIDQWLIGSNVPGRKNGFNWISSIPHVT